MKHIQQIFLEHFKKELRHIKDFNTFLALGWYKTPHYIPYTSLGFRTMQAVHYAMGVSNQTRTDIYDAFRKTVHNMNDERLETSLRRMEHNELVGLKYIPRPNDMPKILRSRDKTKETERKERNKLYRKLSEQWRNTCIGKLPRNPQRELTPYFNA